MNTYKINVRVFDVLEAQLAKLNKKAEKLGCKPAVLTVHGEETVIYKSDLTGIQSKITYKIVSIEGETPKLDGWKLIAAIECQASGENLVSCVPGETVPVSYRSTDTHCDHCNSDRRRKEVFILQNEDGRYAQVGRNCISDFLGGKSPDAIVAYAQWGFDLDSLMSSAEDFEGFGGGRGETTFNLEEFVKTTSAMIRKFGWVSRGTAGDSGDATADRVIWLLSPSFDATSRRDKEKFVQTHSFALEDHDEELSVGALAWGIALPTDQGDYLYNLGVACRIGFVRLKTAGLVASLVSAYQRHLDREAELHISRTENAAKNRKHLGVVGDRCGFAQVTIKSIRSFPSDWGVRTMVRFEDAEGSILVWWKSGDTDMEEGQTLDISGTVKKHEDYKGTPQTILQRVTEGLPKVKKTRTKKAA